MGSGGGRESVGWVGWILARGGCLELCPEASGGIGALAALIVVWIWLSAEVRHCPGPLISLSWSFWRWVEDVYDVGGSFVPDWG